MAEKQISILLIAKDLASKTIGKVNKQIGKLGKTGAIAGRGLRSLAGNLAKVGAVAAVGIGVAVKQGIDSLATLESAVSSVQGALEQMGQAGKITGGQVATWANEIEGSVQAAFDDKDITAATASLVRYGKVAPANLRRTMVVMTDLAARTGDVGSAGELLGKALANPAKAAGKLARQGIYLTKAQQKQIETMTKAGDVAGAQAYLLGELEKSTKGAASAMNGPYNDAMNTLSDTSEDAKRALAEGFLPVIQRVADWLSKKLADPKVVADIRSLGQSLAGAFDKAVTFAQNIPWGAIKDAMTLMGKGAKAALDLFTGMPAWVQTAVLTGWGLNKLTGGALGDIVGELGKGLIKGVLGINAGVVNVNGGVVNGGGGGIPSPAGGVAGTGVSIGTAATGVGALAVGAAVLQGIKNATAQLAGTIAGGDKAAEAQLIRITDIGRASVGPLEMLRRLPEDVGKLIGFVQGSGAKTVNAVDALKSDTRSEGIAQRQALDGVKAKQAEAVVAFRAAERTFAHQKPPQVFVTPPSVKVYVTAQNVTRAVAVANRVGVGTSSRSSSGGYGNAAR